jgi:alkanesulfonate monooxygenase SsuD/methylene tetrahydromethanopterin reductase-like flavin-dependent oxidoreductase (luciferase family)
VEKPFSRRADEVESVFNRTRPAIRFALVSSYCLSEEEARGAEEDLSAWFERLARRGGVGQIPVKLLRMSLLSAACQYGRSFQLWKLGGEQSVDAQLNEVLAREPDDVAATLDRRFEEERS